jgi:hypothetical protein
MPRGKSFEREVSKQHNETFYSEAGCPVLASIFMEKTTYLSQRKTKFSMNVRYRITAKYFTEG